MLQGSRLVQCISLKRVICASSRNRHNLQKHQHRYATLSALSAKSHYEVLGLKKDASQSEIKDAFVKLSKEYHPDLNQTDPHTHDKFVKLHEAYQVLSRPQSRLEYDVSMAHRFHFQQQMARHGFTSHYPNNSNMPGGMGASSGPSYQGADAENKQFWDETLYNMRKTSKDDHYPEDQYYGVKGVRKMSNSIIVVGCVMLMGFGVLLHLAAVKYSRHYSREILDKRDRVNLAFLQETQARAKKYGNAHQIEILRARLKEVDEKRAASKASESSQHYK